MEKRGSYTKAKTQKEAAMKKVMIMVLGAALMTAGPVLAGAHKVKAKDHHYVYKVHYSPKHPGPQVQAGAFDRHKGVVNKGN